MNRRRIGIIGGGASGVLVALNLLEHERGSLDVTVFEPRRDLGRGVAYSTTHPAHRLNVPAGLMSAFVDDPTDFIQWSGAPSDDFVSRHLYGGYLQHRLIERVNESGSSFEHCRQRVAGIGRVGDQWSAVTDETDPVQPDLLDSVVLALGNASHRIPAVLLPLAGDRLLITDPWAPGALDTIGPGSRVLVVGTGLTFVDVALALMDTEGVTITGLSRHGLLPQTHGPSRIRIDPPDVTSLGELTRWFRSHGDSWRDAYAALRPLTSSIWRSLSDVERRRFLRHAMRHWETHRHRMAPFVADALGRHRRQGRVAVSRGRIRGVEICGASESADTDGDVTALVRTDDDVFVADRIVLCTGSDDRALLSNGVAASLLAEGFAREAPLGLGLDVDSPSGRLLDRTGNAVPTLFAVGPLRRGTEWETTAIPEIRTQARLIADHIAPRRQDRPATED